MVDFDNLKDGLKDGLKGFGKTVRETAELVAFKTEETVEIQKIKKKICGLRRNNKKDYQEIGRLVYEKFAEDGDVDEEFLELCEQIAERKATIEEYKEEIEQIRE